MNAKGIESYDETDKRLFSDFRLTYQTGKGNNHLVPILFPSDTLTAMRFLCDSVIRTAADIHENNNYVFASAKRSLDHVSGWHAVNRMSIAAGVQCPELLNPTRMRHLISTLYAAQDVSENERQLFYKHLGHSESMNANVYQTPLAHKEVTHVGAHLAAFDNC